MQLEPIYCIPKLCQSNLRKVIVYLALLETTGRGARRSHMEQRLILGLMNQPWGLGALGCRFLVP